MLGAHPLLVRARLDRLQPTQITVGKAEVAQKRKEWGQLGKKARSAVLEQHWFPGIAGPDGRQYIIDHHHFGLALLEEGVKSVWLVILKDLSPLDSAPFWSMMDHMQWVRPYGADGLRHGFDALPARLDQMQDDPVRSLAGALRRAGGFAKDIAPFSEFLWADFLRRRIAAPMLQKDFAKASRKAMQLAHSPEASYLPGWVGAGGMR
jgi:hypothetical protein